MGGEARYSLSALSRQSRSVVPRRLQRSKQTICRTGQVDYMCKAIGIDLYNQSVTGKVAKTLNAIKSDADHVPCVITWCIGNGQVHDAVSPSEEVSKTLNCMCDPMKILIIK